MPNQSNPISSCQRWVSTDAIVRRVRDLPDSFVNAICFCMSPALTVGLLTSIDFEKSLMLNKGSCSSSDSTSVHDFSIAPGAPGEHGASFLTDPSSVSTEICAVSAHGRTWSGNE